MAAATKAMESRIRAKKLLSKIGSGEDAANLVKDGMTLGIPAGNYSASPGTFLAALKKELSVRSSSINIKLLTMGPASSVEEEFVKLPNLRWRKYGQLASHELRKAVNSGDVDFIETRLGLPTYQIRKQCYENIDLVVIEAAAITEEGCIVPSTALVDGPGYIANADRVIVEINPHIPEEIEGIHDVYYLENPPNRKAVPLNHVTDRIGTPYISINPEKIAVIIESSCPDNSKTAHTVGQDSEAIADHLLHFLTNEVRKGRLPARLLPLQFGIGAIPTAFSRRLARSSFADLEIFSGSVEDGALDLIDAGKAKGVSACALYFSKEGFKRFFASLEHYKRYIVLRPAEIADCPELISRLGVIALNGAIEVDIYGHVNATHILGSKSIGGVGGSCEFVWNAYLSVILLRSTSADGNISTIVPMVTHVDHPEHAIDIIVTEQGLADLRGLTPIERAQKIVANCAHSDYKPMLTDYLEESIKKVGGHEPHLLRESFSFHTRFIENGRMRT